MPTGIAPTSNTTIRTQPLYLIFSITLASVMGVSSIAPAFPAIADAMEVSTGQIGLLITFFTIPGILFTPIFGILADRLNRKVILVPSLLLFGFAGAACATATDFDQLLLYRALQGMGSASLGVINLTLIGDYYEGRRRAEVMGYNGSVLSVGTAIYPAIGGGLALIGWYAPFLLSLLAVPVAIAALFLLESNSTGHSMSMGLYLKEIAGSLFKRHVVALLLCMFLTTIILYGGYITFFTIFLDEQFGLSTLTIGIFLSTSSLMTAVTSASLGRLLKYAESHHLIRIAALLYTLIFLSLPWIETLWVFLIPIVFFGIAQGMNIPSILTLLTSSAPESYRAAFLSVNWIVMRIGQSLGPYLLGIVYGLYQIRATFWVTAIAGGLFLLTSLLLLRGVPPVIRTGKS
ncbi:MAG: MFS transporter [Bacteroidota bacterium]